MLFRSQFHGIWVPVKESWIVGGCANELCKGGADEEWVVLSMGLQPEAAELWAHLDDAAVTRMVEREWVRLFPAYEGRLRPLNVARWPCALPVYRPGWVGRVRSFLAEGQGAGGVYLCGDYLAHPWMEGSVRCGEEVAARVLRERA